MPGTEPGERDTRTGPRSTNGEIAEEGEVHSLLHHVDVGALREAFAALKRTAAAGVDGKTWKDYEAGLELKLADLHGRVHRGAYRALPSRRVYIPKHDGKQRPLAIAALEDKIVQRAVLAVLNEIYEADFLGSRTGSDRDADSTMRWMRCRSGSPAGK